jgi:hypothetical protein
MEPGCDSLPIAAHFNNYPFVESKGVSGESQISQKQHSRMGLLSWMNGVKSELWGKDG